MKRLISALIILFVLSSLVGCISIESVPDKYEMKLNPLLAVGTKADILREYGPPQRENSVGNSEFWFYHFSYGTRSVYTPSQGHFRTYLHGKRLAKRLLPPTPGKTTTYELYEEILLEFDSNDILISWKQIH